MKVSLNRFPWLVHFRIFIDRLKVRITWYTNSIVTPREPLEFYFDFFALWIFRYVVGDGVCSFFVSGSDHMVFEKKDVERSRLAS